MSKRHFLVSICAVFFCFRLNAQVVLNEISSRGNIPDQFGNNSDWIEIYNAGPSPVNIFNYGLSDNPLNTLLWQFPDVTINAGAFMVVLANGDGISNSVDHWETAIYNNDTWKYFVGLSEPPAGWNSTAFDDATWSEGTGGIGYGDGDDGTVIPSTTSVYLRKKFSVDDTSAISNAFLHLDYDDGFVAYLNGIEIARSANMVGTGTLPAFNQLTSAEHEAGMYAGYPAELFEIPADVLHSILVPGDNVFSLQVHNVTTGSSDLSSNAWLSFGIRNTSTYFGPVPVWFPVTNTYNHTNFKINNAGETIYLSNASGIIIDQKNTGYLDTYNSVARIPDGSASWCTTTETTPQLTNNFSTCYSGYEPQPVFSLSPGFYSGTQTVSISSGSPTSVIRYTVDGSNVKDTSPVYTGPLTFDTTSIISAKCFSSAGKLPGQMVKNSYFIDEPTSTLPVISISTDPGSLWNIDTGIYVFGQPDWDPSYPYFGANFWEPWQRFSNIEYFDESGTQQFSKNMALEIHGGWSRAEDQRSFRIDFKSEYDGNLNFQLFPDQKPAQTSINNFNLRNGGQHVWASKIQDAFLAKVMDKTNIDYEASQPCIVYLNGQYWGVYEIREKADEHYVESNYGFNPDKIDLLNGWSTLAGSDTGYTNLYNWVLSNDPASDSAFYNGFAARVDVNNYVDYFIGEIYYQNVDFGGYYWGLNNIKIWRYQNGGKWRHIIYDLDGAMGWFGSSPYDNYIDFTRNPYYPSYSSQIFDRVLYNNTFKNYFINRFADLINTIYQADSMQTVAYSMRDTLYPEMPRHTERWPYFTVDDWVYYIDNILAYNDSRILTSRVQIKNSFALNAQKEFTLNASPTGAGHIQISTIIPGPLPWSGIYFDGNEVTLKAIPDPGFTFAYWEANDIIPSGSTEQTITINPTYESVFTAVFTGTAVTPKITVTEINYNSNASVNSGDWVEIYNNDTIPFDLSGWKLHNRNEINEFEIPVGTIVNSGAYLVIAQDTSLFSSINPGVLNVIGGMNFSFDNNGDEIKLHDLDNNIIFSLNYADSLNWPKGADGTGRTLELINPGYDLNNAESWFDGCILGSPGSPYNPCNPDIVISEINYHSSASMNAGDWVEIWNTTTNTIDITNWKFADDADSSLYIFPAGTNLLPGERKVISQNISLFTEQHPSVTDYTGPFAFTLDGGGEELRLIDNTGKIKFSVIYQDDAPWPAEPDGMGKTLELADPYGKMNEALNWFAGCPGGSPAMPYDPTCGTTSVTENENDFSLNVFPNPATDYFIIKLNIQSSQLKNTHIELADNTGKVILKIEKINEAQIKVQRNKLAPGIYYVKLIQDNKNADIKKIVLL